MNTQDVTSEAMDTFVAETGGWVASQLEACTRCGMCAEACHFYVATGNPEYAPVWKMDMLRRAYNQRFTLSGRLRTAVGLEKRIDNQDLLDWSSIVYHACTVCNKCALVCPMGIQIGPLIHDVRSGLAEAGVVPEDLETAVQKQISEGSPLGVTDDVFEDRLDWVMDDWDIEFPVDKAGADTLVIFSSIEIMKFPDNLAAIAKIMDAAGENWTLSTKAREVVNFGLYEGNAEHTKLFLRRVLEGAKELGVKRIVVTECGHAYDALRWTAANLMDVPADLEITHITHLLGEFIGNGRIKVKKGALDNNGTITFHDACKIQRRGGHIAEPRTVLRTLAPNSFKELTPNKEQAICCGGGGGVIAIKEADDLRRETFRLKIDQVNNVGAHTVAMSCSNCRLQFLDCKDYYDLDWEIVGLSKLVADALEVE